jgi:hypothetical protein
MILFPRAVGTVNAPPLMAVPGAAVMNVRVWQTAQPTEVNNESPRWAAAGIGFCLPGALVAAMKSANANTSPPSSSGSATGSKADGKVTLITPSAVLAGFSLVPAAGSDELLPLDPSNLLVIPISFKYASPAKKADWLVALPAEAANT